MDGNGDGVSIQRATNRNNIKLKHKQSPWDFSSFAESVADEHTRRSTTSIDFKISKALQQCPALNPIANSDSSDLEECSDSEPHHQEDYKAEDDDDEVGNTSAGGEGKSFFGSVEGVSYHANSFLELHISRPLLRACEALGYSKLTPIQAACIPLALNGRDICGSAITGSGKVLEQHLVCAAVEQPLSLTFDENSFGSGLESTF